VGFVLLSLCLTKAAWGGFFSYKRSPLSSLLSRGNFFRLRIAEQEKGYLRSIFLEKEGALCLFSTVDEVARVEDNTKFIRNSKTLRKPFWVSVVEILTGTTWPLRSSAAVGGGDLLLSSRARNGDGAGL